MTKLNDSQIMRLLRKLKNGMPDDRWLFLVHNSLSLMMKSESGEYVFDDNDEPAGNADIGSVFLDIDAGSTIGEVVDVKFARQERDN